MRKLFLLASLTITLFILVGCGKKMPNDENQNNILKGNKSVVLYFSVTKNTERIAKIISEETNSDLIEITPKVKYSTEDINYNNNDSRANKEQNDSKSRPEIENTIDISEYETIYLGYPIWWGTVPKIIYTLLDNYNFNNKRIILFCTSGSTGIETSVSDLKDYNRDLNIIGSKRFSSYTTSNDIKSWLEENDYFYEEESKINKDSFIVIINNEKYDIKFEDNEATKSFLNMLPSNFNMTELNGNEKYVYLEKDLPTDSYNPKRINAGDVMLYGKNCLVIFYKSFDTSYSYTKIGHIENLPDLGNGNITVSFQ